MGDLNATQDTIGTTPRVVVLDNEDRRELRHLFNALNEVGILRVVAIFKDTGHWCDCGYCGLPDCSVGMVTLDYESGHRQQFSFSCPQLDGDGEPVRAVTPDYKDLSYILESIEGTVFDIHLETDDIFEDTCQTAGWMQFDAGSGLVKGGRVEVGSADEMCAHCQMSPEQYTALAEEIAHEHDRLLDWTCDIRDSLDSQTPLWN
jgi:hypothetical protein